MLHTLIYTCRLWLNCCDIYVYLLNCLQPLPQAMEHGRAAKLQKIKSFRRACPHVTASGMAAILQEIDNHGAPELKQRKHFKEARDLRISKHHAYGPLVSQLPVTLCNGDSKTIPVVNVLSLLQALYSQDGSFTDLLKQTCRRTGCNADSPLHLLYYNDEVVCGNPLAHDITRKLQLVYGSICEFGAHVLSKEEAWFVMFCCRSSEVAKIQGGMSQVTACILKHLFHHDLCSLQHGGLLPKDSAGAHQRIFIKLGFMIQDGLAQKSIWSLKGDAGTRYCLFCSNLVSARSSIGDDELLTCNYWGMSQIVLANDQDLKGTLQRLQDKATSLSKADFKLWEQVVGFNYCEYSLPWDTTLSKELLPLQHFVHDYMHTFFVKGVFNTTMYHLLDALQAIGGLDMYKAFASWVGLWVLSRKDDVSKVFPPKRKEHNKQASTFKCTAGEGLSIGPLMALYLSLVVIPAAICIPQCMAFLAMMDMLDLLVATPHGVTTPALLNQAAKTFLDACVAAGWQEHMHSKHHWLLHFGFHLQKFIDAGLGAMMPNCFVNERKHKLARRYGGDINNTRTFEIFVTHELLCHDLDVLQQPNLFSADTRLDKNCKAPSKLMAFLEESFGKPLNQCFTCAKAHLAYSGPCQRGDVVIMKVASQLKVGQIYLHAACEGQIYSVVAQWEIESFDAKQGHAVCKKSENTFLAATASILCAVPWCQHEKEWYRILVPL